MDPAEITSRGAFGAALTELRERAGLTVRDVAKAVGMATATVGGYFAGSALPPLKTANVLTRIVAVCGITDRTEIERWHDALKRLRRSPSRPRAATAVPYRGLPPFEREDAQWFFGRENLVRDLVERVAGGDPVLVVGPSGAGKSSVLRAGLASALPDGQVVLTQPSAGLDDAENELGTGGRKVLIVDQFEELFRMSTVDIEAYLERLMGLARRHSVVFGMRADFYGHAARYPELVPALQHAVVVAPMTDTELRTAIEEPARRAGVEPGPGLAELLIHELSPAGHGAGLLPLLSHSLRATWLRGGQRRLTIADYQATGGMWQAVALSADAVYESLTEQQQRLARRLFRRLVHVDDTRRRVSHLELTDGRQDAELTEVLDRFIDERLITADEEGVVITHEALIRAWPRLRDWTDEDRAGRRVHRQLSASAEAWDDGGREEGALSRGVPLATITAWAADHTDDLNALEREFLTHSAQREERERQAQRRQVVRLRALVSALVVLVLVITSLTILVQSQRSAAEHDRDLAASRQVGAQSRVLRSADRTLAAQLALAAYRISPTSEARASLLDVSTEPLVTRMAGTDEVLQGAAVNGGLLAVAGTDKHVRLWDITDRSRPRPLGDPLPGPTDTVFAVAISQDGRTLAAAGADRIVRLWDVADRAHVTPLNPLTGPENTVYSLAFSPDGKTLAAGSADKTVRLWDVTDPRRPAGLGTPLTGPAGYVQTVVFSGNLLAAGGADKAVWLWNVADRANPVRLAGPLTGARGTVFSVAFSPDGRTLAAGSSDRAVQLWHLDDPTHPVADPAPLMGSTGWVNSVAFSPDGARLAVGASDNQVRVWDLAARRVIHTLPHPGPVTVAGFLDGGRTVFSAAADGTARLWSLPGGAITDPSTPVFGVVYPAQGHLLAVSSGRADDSVELWDTSDPAQPRPVGEPLTSPAGTQFSGAIGFDPAGRLFVTGSRDGAVQLWGVGDPAHPALRATLPGDGAQVESFAFSPDGLTLAVSGDDHQVRLYGVATPSAPTTLATLTGPTNYVYSAAFSPDGGTLAAGSADNGVWLWNVRDPARPVALPKLAGFRGYVYGVAFVPQRPVLAAGSADKTVRLWDLSDPAHPVPLGAPITGPSNYVYGIAISPDGHKLAIGSTDASVRLVDISRPEAPIELATMTGATDAVYTVTFTPDGAGLAAGTAERRVRFWTVDPERVAERICATVGTPLTEAEWRRYVPDVPFTPRC